MKFGKWSDGREFAEIEGYRFPIKNNRIFEGFNYELNSYKVVLMGKVNKQIRPIPVGAYESGKYVLVEK